MFLSANLPKLSLGFQDNSWTSCADNLSLVFVIFHGIMLSFSLFCSNFDFFSLFYANCLCSFYQFLLYFLIFGFCISFQLEVIHNSLIPKSIPVFLIYMRSSTCSVSSTKLIHNIFHSELVISLIHFICQNFLGAVCFITFFNRQFLSLFPTAFCCHSKFVVYDL